MKPTNVYGTVELPTDYIRQPVYCGLPFGNISCGWQIGGDQSFTTYFSGDGLSLILTMKASAAKEVLEGAIELACRKFPSETAARERLEAFQKSVSRETTPVVTVMKRLFGRASVGKVGGETGDDAFGVFVRTGPVEDSITPGSQETTSLRIYNYTETLFEEVKRESEVNVGLAMKFGHAYGKEMARFIREHQEFFARALKASELFVWMCFGITTDEVFQNNGIMAASYALASADS
ncbi:hypothetical protein J6590_086030 [Homalodisca vitripennis]|nr:hypothetical protein J6590_086030 [Homalodisca vitripennis]